MNSTEKFRILIIEDDTIIANQIKNKVEGWGMQAEIVTDFENILTEFTEFSPHLILLDIKLPYYDGYYWCNEFRRVSSVPIIFISSASENMNIIMALNMGGDDFVSKPFDLDILNVKLQALLRRTYSFSNQNEFLECRGSILNIRNQTLSFDGNDLELTKNEFKILEYLFINKDKVVSRDSLMERLWKSELFVDENTLTVNINRLRKKLSSIGLENFIITKRGQGYIINEERYVNS